MYDGKVWFGIVEEKSEEFGDFFIKFMHPTSRSSKFIFPESDDACWVLGNDILCTIGPPTLTTERGGYSISQDSQAKVAKARTLWDRAYK